MSVQAFLYDPYAQIWCRERFASRDAAEQYLLPLVVTLLERRYRELPRIEQEDAGLYFNHKGRVRKAVRVDADYLQSVTEAFWSEFEEGFLEWGIKPI
jgi:hypothetical protein